LSGDNFDVDHIVPKTLLFDDSQTNKVLVHRTCNATKTNQTAYDYIASKGNAELDLYLIESMIGLNEVLSLIPKCND
jgi:CRISPR-associated endonuclease Csn1